MRLSFLFLLALCFCACKSSNPGSESVGGGTSSPDSGTANAGSQTTVTGGTDDTGAGGRGGSGATAGRSGGPTNTGGKGGSTSDGGRSGGGGGSTGGVHGDAQVAQPDAAAHKPVFTKTACIDPSTITSEADTSYSCDGVTVWVALPSQCKTRQCGLIFNIHGGGMPDKNTMEQATNMIALGKANDYVVVHPHSDSLGTWSLPDDKNVVFALMEQAIEAFDVDRKRIHSTGYSQGGQLSWALACEHADVIASIAPAEEYNQLSECWKGTKLPAREIPILYAYGKQDSIGGGYDTAQTQVDQVVKSHSMTGPKTIAGADGTNYHRQRWESASGNVLEFISHNYSSLLLAGHCLPQEGVSNLVTCFGTFDYNWGEEVMTFFKAHPMP